MMMSENTTVDICYAQLAFTNKTNKTNNLYPKLPNRDDADKNKGVMVPIGYDNKAYLTDPPPKDGIPVVPGRPRFATVACQTDNKTYRKKLWVVTGLAMLVCFATVINLSAFVGYVSKNKMPECDNEAHESACPDSKVLQYKNYIPGNPKGRKIIQDDCKEIASWADETTGGLNIEDFQEICTVTFRTSYSTEKDDQISVEIAEGKVCDLTSTETTNTEGEKELHYNCKRQKGNFIMLKTKQQICNLQITGYE